MAHVMIKYTKKRNTKLCKTGIKLILIGGGGGGGGGGGFFLVCEDLGRNVRQFIPRLRFFFFFFKWRLARAH